MIALLSLSLPILVSPLKTQARLEAEIRALHRGGCVWDADSAPPIASPSPAKERASFSDALSPCNSRAA